MVLRGALEAETGFVEEPALPCTRLSLGVAVADRVRVIGGEDRGLDADGARRTVPDMSREYVDWWED